MNEIIHDMITVVIAVISGGLVQFFVNRHDNKKGIEIKLDKIISEQKKSEKDSLRVQLLVMMNLMPDNKDEIMQLAQRYFGELKGDWFYSSLFNRWMKDNKIDKPIWFEKD